MRPRIFIGSSTKGTQVAYAAQANLSKECEVEVWDQGVFGPGDIILERLLDILNRFDAAVLVFTPDDEIVIAGKELSAPRDNAVFELGLFMGRHGREKVFVISPVNAEKLRILSDLGGVIRGEYDPKAKSLQAALAVACNKILEKARDMAPRFGIWVGSNWNPLGRNWRTYGAEASYIDVFDDIAFGPGRFRWPGTADFLNAPWRVLGVQIQRDRVEDPVEICIATEQSDGTKRKICFGTHYQDLCVLPGSPDELRVPIRYYNFDEWSCLRINVETMDHEMIRNIRRATGLRVTGPLRVRHIFFCESAEDLPVGFMQRAIDVL